MEPFTLTKRIKVGLAFMYVAGIGWLADIIIPFTPINNKGLWFTIALVIAETSFLIGLALVGRPTYKALKARILARFRRPPAA